MACTLWIHFLDHHEELYTVQTHDWLIRFQDRESALVSAKKIFGTCEETVTEVNKIARDPTITAENYKIYASKSRFPQEVTRIFDRRKSLYDTYRYWHEDVLIPLSVIWDPVVICDDMLLKNDSGQYKTDFPSDDDECFALGTIRSETLWVDFLLGDELFVPSPSYYKNIAYVTPEDAFSMLSNFPNITGTPFGYYKGIQTDITEREEPYDFTKPLPTIKELDDELEEYTMSYW